MASVELLSPLELNSKDSFPESNGAEKCIPFASMVSYQNGCSTCRYGRSRHVLTSSSIELKLFNLHPAEMLSLCVTIMLCFGLGVMVVWCFALHRKTNSIGREIERLEKKIEEMRRMQRYCNCKSRDDIQSMTAEAADDAEEYKEVQNRNIEFLNDSKREARKETLENRDNTNRFLQRDSGEGRPISRSKRNVKNAANQKQMSPNLRKKAEKFAAKEKHSKKLDGFRLEGKDLDIQSRGGQEAIIGWIMTDWSTPTFNRLYKANTGRISIHANGLYLIFSQIIYYTVSPLDGYAIVVNGKTISKCFVSVDYVDDNGLPQNQNAKYKTCHVTIVQRLERDQTVWIKSLNMENKLFHDNDTNSNFWGMVRLSD